MRRTRDSTELTGDIKLSQDCDLRIGLRPRARSTSTVSSISPTRGIIEFIEMLKLDVAFLYDLLGASQEHKIKSKKFAQTDIDEVIIGHTKLAGISTPRKQTSSWRALKDRTVRIDIPYITRPA
jgi:serine protein kinase